MSNLKASFNEPQGWRYTASAYIILGVCSLIYFISSIMAPQSAAAEAFRVPTAQRIVLQLSIVIPVLVIWTIALKATLSFKNYAIIIEGSPEAIGISRIANGLLWLVVYLVLTSLLGVAVQYFISSPWLEVAVIIKNHLPVIASLIAFIMLYRGSLTLKAIAEDGGWAGTSIIIAIVFSIFAAVMAWVFTISPYDASGPIPNYGLPQDVNFFTLILPYILAWFIGLLAALNILNYTRFVKGSIYRQALRRLVWGILSVISFAATLQLVTVISKIFSSLSLAPLLLIVYALIVLYGVGFIFVHLGARKLTRIEVVQ